MFECFWIFEKSVTEARANDVCEKSAQIGPVSAVDLGFW